MISVDVAVGIVVWQIDRILWRKMQVESAQRNPPEASQKNKRSEEFNPVIEFKQKTNEQISETLIYKVMFSGCWPLVTKIMYLVT